ncbi:methyl-accepting chemotaxis protein [Pseudoduganella violacea]|uniref:Methyl-accepting chemotaxis protein-1 (Serine sensor receptor) n=1 Tax=Pseudoduganella violacea TaxID=1715466 RepID=A0A7W5BCQ1_9BURK|nr:methyl-accepting chemotaxis protein [Pseudoduganella violacea]MBB3120699.1 methyl-accepting chemotaxis protein-1 (serine sensor receptor) [Pseudoduganella violacea]
MLNNLKHLTIRMRLAFVITFLSVLLVAGGIVGLVSLAAANNALRANYEDRMLPMAKLDQIVRLVLSNQLSIAESVDAEPAQVESEMREVEQRMREIGDLTTAYMASGLTEEEGKLAREFVAARGLFVAQGLKPAIAALRAQDHALARSLVHGPIRDYFAPVRKHVDALMQLQLSEAKREFENTQTIYQRVRASCLVAIAFGLLLSGVIGILLQRAIVRPLDKAVRVARAVAEGDLTQHIEVHARDETGQLISSLKDMNGSLARIVGDVRDGTDAIASAARGIAQENADLALRTEQQAAALEQTAASMAQLTVTVRQNGSSAQRADQLAQSASAVAQKGGAVVEQVVQTMGSINQSAARIADIIGVIDNIAFQTNLLALNAAVEAARAGEQGRGFAVVASEVQQLAQQSAKAAGQIRELITESRQQAIAGAQLADQAGGTMSDILSSVEQVTDIMRGISDASRDQTAGIEQVNNAISGMDQGTRENTARVEEVAAAAQALQERADRLRGVVAVFRLNTGGTVAPAPRQAGQPLGRSKRAAAMAQAGATIQAFGDASALLSRKSATRGAAPAAEME